MVGLGFLPRNSVSREPEHFLLLPPLMHFTCMFACFEKLREKKKKKECKKKAGKEMIQVFEKGT